MAPDEVMDYLVLHELVHQVHRNHSKEFWNTLASHCRDYRIYNTWLKEHSYLLALYFLSMCIATAADGGSAASNLGALGIAVVLIFATQIWIRSIGRAARAEAA